MRKILNILISVVFIAVMVLNIEINANANNENDIRLENAEALACYMVFNNGQYLGDCCPPWFYDCIAIPYVTIPGMFWISPL